MVNKQYFNAYIAIVVGVISVSLSAIFVKLTASPSGLTAFYRMLISVLIMLPLFLWKYKHEVKVLNKKDWVLSSIAGVMLAFHFIIWFESLNYTSIASSTVLVTLQPIFAFVGTYFFFKEKITLKSIIAALVAISGSVWISIGDFRISGSALYGDILALIACAFITGYLLFGQEVRKRLSLITYTMIVYCVSSITLLIYVLIVEGTFVPIEQMDWLYFLLLAIVPNLLGHTLFNYAVKWVSTNTISMAILFEPIGATILAYLIFNEKLITTQIIGGTIVVFGLIIFVVDFKSIKNYFRKTS